MENKNIEKIKFHYDRLPSYRTFYVDGVYGGVSPKGKIFIEFFSEKTATPKYTEHKVSDKGKVGEILNENKVEGIIREIECGIYLDLETASVIANWLNGNIEQFKNIIGSKISENEDKDAK